MPRVIEITVYTIDELSDAAKEAARAWYRQSCLDYEWYDFVYEDFQTICGILGVTLRTSPVRLHGGGTRDKPHLYWTGFSSQGDGARSKARTAMPGAPPRRSAAMRPRMTSCTALPTRYRPSKGGTSGKFTARSSSAGATATNTR